MFRRVIAALATLTVACSLTNLDGLAGGSASSPDGGAVGAIDATAGDASADSAATTGVLLSCANAPAGAFCDDFENGLSRWDDDTSAGNTFVVDTVSSTSPTHSLLATITKDGASCLSKTFAGAPTVIEVDVDLRVESVSSAASDYDLIGLRGDGDHNLTLELRGGKLGFDQDVVPVSASDPDEERTLTSYVVDSAWHHLHWTNRISGSKANVEVLVDGVKIGEVTASAADYDRLTLDLGDCVTNDPGSTPWRVRYDNVVVVAK